MRPAQKRSFGKAVSNLDQPIERAVSLLQNAHHAVALTGAGISTPSGIPDFRSPESGLWDNADPYQVASLFGFQQRPESFYNWVRPLILQTMNAAPNPAHYALRDLELYGPLKSVITQNIDVLHTRAGSQVVREIHGHMREMTCLYCEVKTPATEALISFANGGSIPVCTACGQIVKPDVILFGELLPLATVRAAEADVAACDVMIVAGSSLEVAPVNNFPVQARRNGAKLIIVNLSETYVDGIADVVIRGDVAEVLPRLAAPFSERPPDSKGIHSGGGETL